MRIDRLLAPKSIAIVGASARSESPGWRIFAGLKRLGYQGEIFLINPTRAELDGHPCLASIADLPPNVDVAALCVAKNAVEQSLKECAGKAVGAAVVFAAGYAEQDDEGALEQQRLANLAREAGIALLGPNCLGFANIGARAPITMVHVESAPCDRPGVAIVTQSGAFMSSLYATMRLKSVPVSHMVSVGNQAVLGAEQVLEHVLEDEATAALAIFAERLREPRRFLDIAARARHLRKPIVLMHTGKSSKARSAAQSHTGALAGDDAIMRALVSFEGVILVDSIDELADVAALAALYPAAPSKGVGVVTNSGAIRGITFDFCEAVGLDVPALAEDAVAKVASRLPPFAVPENPIDLTVQTIAEPDLIGFAAKTLADDPNIGSVVIVAHAGKEAAEYAQRAAPMLADSVKPIAYSLLGEGAPASQELTDALKQHRIPLFRSMERALGAVAHLTRYGASLGREAARANSTGHALAAIPAPPQTGVLSEYESKQWFKALGLPVPQGALAGSLDEARAIAGEIGFPLALKAQSKKLMHKSDAGAVLLNIDNEETLASDWARLHENVRRSAGDLALDGVLVERMARKGVELVVGVKRDDDWGPVLLIGLGGVFIEILNDVRLLPADIGAEAIEDEIKKLKASKILFGARGAPPSDIAAIAKIASTIGAAARAHPEIIEIDVNPVVVYPKGEGAVALDGLVVTSSP